MTLECKEEFLRGLSKKHFDVLQRWAEVQNLAFNTPEDRKLARATLNDVIRAVAPHVAQKHRNKFAALVEGGAGAETGGNIVVAHVPSSYRGMASVTAHETAVATRSDGGAKPRGPRYRKGKPKLLLAAPLAPASLPNSAIATPGNAMKMNLSNRFATASHERASK